MPLAEIIPLVLTAVLASIPVALPATFTLAAALGAQALARLGVLPTRLSAVDEAAIMDVLCSDKTGTLTRNELTVTAVASRAGFDEAHFAGTRRAREFRRRAGSRRRGDSRRGLEQSGADLPKLIKFVPFDPGDQDVRGDGRRSERRRHDARS